MLQIKAPQTAASSISSFVPKATLNTPTLNVNPMLFIIPCKTIWAMFVNLFIRSVITKLPQ